VYPDVTGFGVLGDIGDLGDRLDRRDTSVHLSWHKDNGRFTKQLREELLEVLNHAHTVKETRESVFHKENELKARSKETRVLYTWGGSHYESQQESY